MIRVLADALTSPAMLVEHFGTAGTPSAQTRKMLDRAIRLAQALKRSPAERAKVVRDLIEKVMIEENTITMQVRRGRVFDGPVVPPLSENPSESPIELTAPVTFRRRGVEMSLVLPGVATENGSSRCDPLLIKAIALGRAWFEELAAGRARSLRELAEREGITRRYVRRLVDLAFLTHSWSKRSCRAGNPLNSLRRVSSDSICRSTGPISAGCWQAEERPPIE